jgi:hypothetical protein
MKWIFTSQLIAVTSSIKICMDNTFTIMSAEIQFLNFIVKRLIAYFFFHGPGQVDLNSGYITFM